MSKDGLADVTNAPSIQMDATLPVGILEAESSPEVQAKEKAITARSRSFKRKADRQPTNAGRKPIRPIDRLKMRPWLIGLLDKNSVVGVQWVNRDELIFQVSWRHAAQHGWSLEKDGDIFERWARHTGKYVDGDNPDPKRWKANFRCALHSLPDVQEVGGNRKGRNACRIYKFHNGALPDKVKQKKRQAKRRASKEPWNEADGDEDEMEDEETDDSERSSEESSSELTGAGGQGLNPLRNSLPFLIKYLQRQAPTGKQSGMVDLTQTSSSGSQPLDLTYRSNSSSASSTPPPQSGNLPLVVQQDAFTADGKATPRTVTVVKVRDGVIKAKSTMLTHVVQSNMIGQPQVAVPVSKTSRPIMGGLEMLLQAAEQQMGSYPSLCEEISNKKQSLTAETSSGQTGSSKSLANGVGHSAPHSSTAMNQPSSSGAVPVAVSETISRLAHRIDQDQRASSSTHENSHPQNPIPHLPAFATDHVYTSTRPPEMNGTSESLPASVIKTEPEDPDYEASASRQAYQSSAVKLEPTDEDRHVMSRSYMEEGDDEMGTESPSQEDPVGSAGGQTTSAPTGASPEEVMETDSQSSASCPQTSLARQTGNPCNMAGLSSLASTSCCSTSANLKCDMCSADGAKTFCIRVPEGNGGMGSYYHRSFCRACSERVVGGDNQECRCPQGWTNLVVPCAEHDNPADCTAGRCVKYSVVLHWTVIN